MDINWADGFEIRLAFENDTVTISANRAGLESLARIFDALARGEAGEHIHLDEYNSLEIGSPELIVEKI